MRGPSPDVCAWLVTDEGLHLVTEVTARLQGSDVLTVGTGLRRDGVEPERAAAVTSVAGARIRARDRYRDADRLVLTPELLEQASHPAVAAWRARRFAGACAVADLCCGAGSDAMALTAFVSVLAVDRDPVACLLADHNLSTRPGRSQVVRGDATAPPVSSDVPIHVDPARRDGSRRLRRLADYHPPLPSLLPVLHQAPGAGVTVSPGVDTDDPDLPPDGELEFVQVGDDLVEAVVWLGDLRQQDEGSTATILADDGGVRGTLAHDGPTERLPVGEVGEWVIEVAPAVVRARLHDQLGTSIGAWRVADRRALLSTDRQPEPSPLYRSWEVEAVLPVRARDVRAWLRDAEDLPLEIATHGMDVNPEELWTQLGSPPRGPAGRRLHMVRLDRGAIAIATRVG